jgi:RNA polymerase sigma-70 factor (ECF subfamily)
VSAILRRNGASARNDSTGTLGDLLYADKGKARVPESEWAGLVRAIAAKDQVALHALHERAHRLVFTLVLRIAGDRQTAEELTVDVFHDIWRRAPAYDANAGTVLGWIMNQARSRAIDRIRHEQRKKRVDPHPHDGSAESVASDASQAVQLTALRGVLHSALTALTPDERQAIESAFFSEMSHAEVAARLDQPLGTIKTRIRSGLDKLRQALKIKVAQP